MRILICLLIALSIPFACLSQKKGSTVVGIQIKPIFPFKIKGTEKVINDTAGVHFETGIESGLNFGLVIRHNFTSLLAFETGINYVKRKYKISISEPGYSTGADFRIISYEIPFVIMAYARMGEKTFANGSLGPSMNMHASSVKNDEVDFHHVAFRNHVIQVAVSANIGVEYRTEKSGNFYLGASFQRPFEFFYLSKIGYYRNNRDILVVNELSGTYFTIDLRYFFPETRTRVDDQ